MWQQFGWASCLFMFLSGGSVHAGFTHNIMLTGYWPPTNEAVRHFSTNSEQNPEGWQGQDWDGLGYDIYSFFPEFEEFPSDRKGTGDFEVDYQDTSEDWWRITSEINPVAIITFSAGAEGMWELETRQRNLRFWNRDYLYPFRPTPAPPDDSVPAGFERESSLPMQEIVDAVNASGLDMTAFIDTQGYGGAFLSEFIAYHGTWYHDLHVGADDPYQNVAAGHIHVGPDIPVDSARLAAEISLRELIRHVDQVLVPEPTGWSCVLGIFLLSGSRLRKSQRSRRHG